MRNWDHREASPHCTEHLTWIILFFFPSSHSEVSMAVITSLVWLRNPRLTEIKWNARGHTACQWQRSNLNAELSLTKPWSFDLWQWPLMCMWLRLLDSSLSGSTDAKPTMASLWEQRLKLSRGHQNQLHNARERSLPKDLNTCVAFPHNSFRPHGVVKLAFYTAWAPRFGF